MRTEMLTHDEPRAPERAVPEPARDELREWAREHVERVRKLKRSVATYVAGMVAVTAIWMLVEWQDNGGFERLSGNDNPGDWEPWVLYVGVIWGFFVVLDAVKVLFDRPTTESEIDREVRRWRSS